MPRRQTLDELESGAYTTGATTLGIVPEFLREEPLRAPRENHAQNRAQTIRRGQRELQEYQLRRALGGGVLPADVGTRPLLQPEWIQGDQPTRHENDAYPGVWFKKQL